MNTIQDLQRFERENSYFESIVSVQSDPSRFNAVGTSIEQRINTITQWLKNEGLHTKAEDTAYAFALLQKYISLWQLYFQNHPWRTLNDR